MESVVKHLGSKEFWHGKRVFLTGHTGFKGSWLCRILETLGADVTGYALAPKENQNLFGMCKPQVKSIIADIRDFETLQAEFGRANPEIVIHMAAQPLVLEGYSSPRYTYDVNVMGTVNILEAARLTGSVQNMLIVTTDKVYKNLKRNEGYAEDETLWGSDPYSNSKSCAELVAGTYRKAYFKSAPLSTARSGNVIGGGDFAENRVIPDCARALAKGGTVKIRNPKHIRPYLHVLDALFAYLLIIEACHATPGLAGAYNIGPSSGEVVTTGDLASYFCYFCSGKMVWEAVNVEAPEESEVLRLDSGKIEKELGWKPHWDIQQSVEKTAEWYLSWASGEDTSGIMDNQISEMIGVYYGAKRVLQALQ